MDEQNKFCKEEKKRREREKQKESIPRKFEPKTPVKVLQRGKQPITATPNQTPKRPRDDKYAQGQNYSWSNGYVEPEYRVGYRTGYSYGTGYGCGGKNWGQGDGYGKMYGAGDKKRQGRAYGPSGTQSHTYYTTRGTRELINMHHQGVLVVAREAMMEMGVIRVMVTRKSIKVPNIILKIWMRRRVIQKILLN